MTRLCLRLLGLGAMGVLIATVAGAASGTVQYTYDEAGRLKGVVYTGGTTTAYGLDAAGNRTSVASAPDTTAPTVPAGLTGTAPSSTQVNLTWTASTDAGSGVAGYRIYRGGTQINTSATASYSDTTTVCNTAYSYTVAAYDGATPVNVSAQSTAWAVTTPITSAPSVPTGLAKVSSTSTQVVLSWTGSTDSCSSVAGYRVYRNGTQIGTSATAGYTDNTTSGTTTYSYTVAAYDSQSTPLVSAQSSPLSVTTPDTIAPSVPTGLTKVSATSTSVVLSWTASTDTGGSGLAGYKIYRGGTQIGTSASASYTDSTTSGTTTYSYTVAAYDSSNNVSAQSSALNVTTPDTLPPSVPTGLTNVSTTSTSVVLSWTASTDTGGSGLAGYKIYRGGTQIGTSATAGYTDNTAVPSTVYSYTVAAYDSIGNTSSQSSALGVTTPADTTAPSIPSALSATAASQTQINLTWSASTDTGGSGLAGYRVYRGGTQIATTTATSYSDTGLSGYTTYSYTVVAYDNAGNLSAQSTAASATTPDQTAPSVPTGLIATAVSSSEIDLSWSASTDTGGSGLAGYKVYRSGTQLFSGSGTTFQNTGLTASTAYSYTVRSYDNAGNTSADSSPAAATTSAGTSTDSITMTEGTRTVYVQYTGNFVYNGYISGIQGSISPSTLTGGRQLASFYDYTYVYTNSTTAYVSVSGFSADPGINWLISASAHGVTKAGSSASSYSYSSGTASWQFSSGFGFTGSGSTVVAVTHN